MTAEFISMIYISMVHISPARELASVRRYSAHCVKLSFLRFLSSFYRIGSLVRDLHVKFRVNQRLVIIIIIIIIIFIFISP